MTQVDEQTGTPADAGQAECLDVRIARRLLEQATSWAWWYIICLPVGTGGGCTFVLYAARGLREHWADWSWY